RSESRSGFEIGPVSLEAFPPNVSLLGPRFSFRKRGKFMKRIILLSLTLMSAISLYASAATAHPARRNRLVVDDDKVECPNATFSTIQAAVDAASPGDEIRICKGVYVEQVSIRKPLTIDADNGAILMPSAMQANAASLFDAAPIATALLIADANG